MHEINFSGILNELYSFLQLFNAYTTHFRNLLIPDPSSSTSEAAADLPRGQETAGEQSDLLYHYCMMYSDMINMKSILFNFLKSLPLPNECMEASIMAFEKDYTEFELILPEISNKIVTTLVKKCSEPLKHIRNIPPQFRRTNKEKPTQCSFFISLIFKPLTEFRDKALDFQLKEGILHEWMEPCINQIKMRYQDQVQETLALVKSIEDGLKRFKKKTNVEDVSDEEKIRMQMDLDRTAFDQIVAAFLQEK
jgi:hypothetical protein